MIGVRYSLRLIRRRASLLAWALAPLLGVGCLAAAAQPNGAAHVLRIGSSGSLGEESKGGGALETLKLFIKDETGFDNRIERQKDWRKLAEKMAKGQLDIGVFMGYEFAWAQAKYPQLHALALAVNVHPYRQVFVVTQKNGKAKDFAGLAGQTLELAKNGQEYPRLVVDHLAQAKGKPLDKFFSQVKTAATAEDALDDVVDGLAQAAAVDRVALEAFKRRKPGRFDRLTPVAQSPHLPPPVVAYFDESLSADTRKRFQEGLLNANQKEKGKELLTLFKLTGFQPIPQDFDKALATTRKDYPPAK